MRITENTLKAMGIDKSKRYFSIGPTTFGYLGLLLTWAVITSHISAWWLVLAIPAMMSSFGMETQEHKPSIRL